jgi:hypothetical protein
MITGSTWGKNRMCNNAKCCVVWQRVVCGLSVVFHCRSYWLLMYSVHSYCNSIQNNIPHYKFTARQCTHANVQEIVSVIRLPIFPLAYNIELLETSHRCTSNSLLLQREVCLTLQLVSVHTVVHRWTDGWLCIISITVLYFQTVTC